MISDSLPRKFDFSDSPKTIIPDLKIAKLNLKKLQTDVHLTLSAKEKGAIRIPFYSADDLVRLANVMLGPNRDSL